jgi:hypothetical protein
VVPDPLVPFRRGQAVGWEPVGVGYAIAAAAIAVFAAASGRGVERSEP